MMFPAYLGHIGLCSVPGHRENAWKTARAIASAGLLGTLIASLTASAALGHAHAHAHAHAHHGYSEPDRHRYPLRGVDVSHYQGAIDWRAVARDDVAFAYVKASEGVGGRDDQFARNWRGAQRAGLRVGAYHYFIFCRSGRAQAHNFLAVAPRGKSALAPAVDLEAPRSCHGRLRGPEMRRELDAYLSVVEAREHRRAVLYVTPDFYAAYHAYLPRRPLWRRSILSQPAPSWTYWQYRSEGRVAGIRTHVDLNVSAGRHVLAL
jgi:lysozyme